MIKSINKGVIKIEKVLEQTKKIADVEIGIHGDNDQESLKWKT